MDRSWWKDIQQVPIFDPEPQESDWKLLFGMNTKNQFHPDLSWADSQWSDHATGVGILAIKAGKVTQRLAANFVAVFTAEGKLLEMRKNVGQPFLGPDNLPLAIQGIVMCGNRPEWKDKASAYSMEDYDLAQNGEEWADGILNPGKAAKNPKSLPTQEIENSLGINVLPGEMSSAAEKDNKKLRKKLQQIMNEYQESAQKAEELEKTNRVLTQGFQKVARQRVAELEARMNQLTENMTEIAEMFEESRKGNGVAMLVRFSGALEKATKILEICRKGMVEKAIQDSGNDDNDNDDDPDDDSEDSESDNDGRRKRRATSPASSTGSKGKKAESNSLQVPCP
jgi:hypothetical protein